MFLSTVSGASDTAYRYLAAFTKWVDRCIFYPAHDERVKVTVTELASPIQLSHECQECRKKFEDSQILDIITSVSWRDIDSFNLRSIVSFRFFFETGNSIV